MKKPLLYLLLSLLVVALCCSAFECYQAFSVGAMVKSEIASLTGAYANINPDTDLVAIRDIWGRYGYMDTKGNIVIQPRFQWADPFSEGLAPVEIGGKSGYIDKTGRVVIKPQFGVAHDFHNGHASVFVEGVNQADSSDGSTLMVDMIDRQGKSVLKNTYSSIGDESDGMTRVTDENQMRGFLDSNFNVAIKPQYPQVENFDNGLAAVQDTDNSTTWGMIDKKGRLVVPFQYMHIQCFAEGLAAVQAETELYGFVDTTGTVKIPCQYKEASFFSEGFAAVQAQTSLYGFVDSTGTTKIPCQYENASIFSEGLAAVQDPKTHLWGFVNTEGKLEIPFSYVSEISSFKDGLAVVSPSKDQSIVIDKTGKAITDSFAQFETITDDGEQVADYSSHTYGYSGDGLRWAVEKPGILTFFDNKGTVKFQVKGDEPGRFSEGLCRLYQGKYYSTSCGYIDMTGKLVIGYQFTSAEEFKNGLAEVCASRDIRDSGYIDKTGGYVWQPGSIRLLDLKEALVFLLVALGLARIIVWASNPKYKVTINPQIDFGLINPDCDLLIIKDEKGRYGYIEANGRVAIVPKFTDACPFSDGLARVCFGSRWRYIDKWGTVFSYRKYVLMGDFHDDRAIVCSRTADGFFLCVIDKQGHEIVPPVYRSILEHSEGMAAMQDSDGKCGFLDSGYQIAIPPTFAAVQDFHQGLAGVQGQVTGLWGFVDKEGVLKIPFQFQDTLGFSDGLAGVQDFKSRQWGFTDMLGNLAIPYIYYSVEDFSDGLAIVRTNDAVCIMVDKEGRGVMNGTKEGGHCGQGLHWMAGDDGCIAFFDNSGALRFDVKGQVADVFSEGLCAVAQIDKAGEPPYRMSYGYIDLDGRLVIEYQFRQAEPFRNGVARVYMGEITGDKFGYIDKTGKYIWEPR